MFGDSVSCSPAGLELPTLSAFTSLMLGLQACATAPGSSDFFFFKDRISMSSSGWLGIYCAAQAGLQLTDPRASASCMLGSKTCATRSSPLTTFKSRKGCEEILPYFMKQTLCLPPAVGTFYPSSPDYLSPSLPSSRQDETPGDLSNAQSHIFGR